VITKAEITTRCDKNISINLFHKGSIRSLDGKFSSVDFDEVGFDDEIFFISDCRAICANASAPFSILSTYNSLKKNIKRILKTIS
jgi:hypothetical protein